MDRAAAFNRLVRVDDELSAATFSISTVSEQWHLYVAVATTRGGRRLSHGDLLRCMENLEVTYILRMFSTFESILRDYWFNAMKRVSDPPLKPMMDSIATSRKMDLRTISDAHTIRDFRNALMHRNLKLRTIDFGECAKALGRYLSWLPERW